MLGKDCADVVIVDPAYKGKAYAPAEFREFCLDTRKWYCALRRPPDCRQHR